MTEKEARRLRGLIQYALQCAAEDAHAGAHDAYGAMMCREEYKFAKEEVWDEIRRLTLKEQE